MVYGLPAIATAIGSRTTVEVQRARQYDLLDGRPETPGYKREKRAQQEDSMHRIFRAMGVTDDRVKIILGGELVAASGVGASGASCSAIAAALNELLELGLDRTAINAVAYEGEKGYHGTPSGIDNSCSTFGGFIWFEREAASGTVKIEPLSSGTPLSVIMGNTGITSNTTKVVEEVRRAKEKDPERFAGIFDEYRKIVLEARNLLKSGDLARVGGLMNRNHALLREIGVSSSELERLVEIALENGALGAKLTGTGRGGLMIALVTDETRDQVASAIVEAGLEPRVTEIGAEGVRIESRG